MNFQIIPHPAHSPELDSSDSHLFPKLKNFLAGQKLGSNGEAIQAVNDSFEGLKENH